MREFNRFFSQMVTNLGGVQSGYARQMQGTVWQPPVDVFEQDQGLVVVVELPGVAQDDIHVTVEKGVLTVRGQRDKQLPEETRHVHQMEIPYGAFGRCLRLPEFVDQQRIDASYRDGYLTIRLPKKQEEDEA
jgi:HSP20 family protein